MTALTLLVSEDWSHKLVMATVDFGIVAIAAAMLMCILRLIIGPHLADRAMAVDTLGLTLIGLVILLTIRLQTLMFFDGVLVLALLSFAGMVAMAQYIARPHLRKMARSGESKGAQVP